MDETKIIEFRMKSVEESLARLSKAWFGNGEKGMAEIIIKLAERVEQRKETHDKDVTRIERSCEKLAGKFERLLWWMVTQFVAILITAGFMAVEVLVKK